MKKFFIGLLNVLLSIFIFLLLFSFYGRTVFSGFVTDFLGGLSTNITDTDFVKENNDDDYNVKVERSFTMEELLSSPKYKELLKNKEVKELIEKYVDSTIVGVTDPKSLNNVDLTEDVINFLKENKNVLEKEYGIDISDEEIDGIKEDDAFKNLTDDYIEKVQIASDSLTSTQKKLIKAYSFVCSFAFKVIMIVLILIDVFLIALFQKSLYKWINAVGVNLLSSGILTIVLGLILHFGINSVVSKMKSHLQFNFLQICLVGLVAAIIGIVMIIIYFVIKKKSENNNMEEMYNEVSRGFDEKFESFDELSSDDE